MDSKMYAAECAAGHKIPSDPAELQAARARKCVFCRPILSRLLAEREHPDHLGHRHPDPEAA